MTAEPRHLRAFLAIAEEGNVTRAAQRLRVGQPALSRTLRQLEEYLGARLVDRSTHHLELTAAGEALLPRARAALSALDAALDPTRLGPWPLRLGHAWSALGDHTTRLLRAWEEARPTTPLELLRIDDRTAGLAQGRVDAALLRGDRARYEAELPLHTELLMTEERVAAVPEGSELAGRARLTLADLADQPVAINTVSGTTDPWLWPADTRPASTVTVANTDDWLSAIAAGRAVGVSAESTESLHTHPGVCYRPLGDVPPLPVLLCWALPPTHHAVGELAALARKIVNQR